MTKLNQSMIVKKIKGLSRINQYCNLLIKTGIQLLAIVILCLLLFDVRRPGKEISHHFFFDASRAWNS